jgi:hypothetical protein
MLDLMPIVIVIVVALATTIATITIFNNHVTSALSNDDKSIAPNYREGYEVGKAQGREEHRSGNVHDDRCPPGNNGILWCIGYEIGYNDGYYDSSGVLKGR